MDNLLEALQKGTAFNVREGARKRTPRTTGAERRAMLQKSRSRTAVGQENAPLDVNREEGETPRRPERRRKQRTGAGMSTSQ